jgi:2-hydroxymuconate-semialdehyde hydrolase
MLADIPVSTRALDLDGVSTAVLEVGAGPPLLLLHGGIECGGAMWAPVLARLAQAHRVVVPDVPGLGESAPLPHLDIDSFSRWLAQLSRAADLQGVPIVAHSLVGSLAAHVASRGSDTIGRLVIYAAPGVAAYRMPARLRYVAIRFAVRPTERNAERFHRYALLDRDATRRRDSDWFDAFAAYTLARARVPHVKRTMRRLVSSGTKPIPHADLNKIEVPTTLLWGRHDRMVPLLIGERAASEHGWPLQIVEDAAHAPHIEQPEAFADTLIAIMASA